MIPQVINDYIEQTVDGYIEIYGRYLNSNDPTEIEALRNQMEQYEQNHIKGNWSKVLAAM